jgi:hypothetical protein
MRRLPHAALAVLAVLAVLLPARTSAQTYTSLGLGAAVPTGDFSDVQERGFTLRGQGGVSLILGDVHVQAGYTHLPGKEGVAGVNPDAADFFQAGVGARLGMGLIFVGGNANYYFGEVERGVGFAPEIGISLLMFEAVADYRVDGTQKVLSTRIGVRF